MSVSKKIAVQRLRALREAGVEEIPQLAAQEILRAFSPAKKTAQRNTVVPPAVETEPSVEKGIHLAGSFQQESPKAAPKAVPKAAPKAAPKQAYQPASRAESSKTSLAMVSDLRTFEELIAMEDRAEALRILAEKVARCVRCLGLVSGRTQTVFGTGNPYARLMFLGEAPGADEDKKGIPFVGRAGKLLTDMIEKGMKISREQDTYVCNILRCRPPGNRTPLPDEAANCRAFLDAQIAIVRPEFICCLGASAAQYLLASTTTISRMRLQKYSYAGATVICTYHPAYLLRNPPQKAATWEDLKFLMQLMGLEE